MNLKDSYLHGTDQTALIRALKWDDGVLKYQSASTSQDWTSIGTIPTWNQDTTGNATTSTNGNHFITTTGTAAVTSSSAKYKSALWNADTSLTLEDGLMVTIKVPVAGNNTTGTALSIDNGTSYHPVVTGVNANISTRYAVNAFITLVYNSAQASASNHYIGTAGTASKPTGCWVVVNDYDSGNSNTYDRTYHNGAVKALKATVAGNLIVGNSSGYWNLKTGDAFDITYPILYAATATAAGSTRTDNYYSIPFTVTTTQAAASWPGGAITAYKAIFIQGKLDGNTFTPISTTPLTQVIPTAAEANGNDYYIYVGDAYSTTAAYLSQDHPIYWFKNGKFQLYNNAYVSSGTGYINGTEITTISGNATTATTADKTKAALTFGTKTFDGSEAKTITLSDLGGQAAGDYVTIAGNETVTGKKDFTGGITVKGTGNAVINFNGDSASVDYAKIFVTGGTNTTRPLIIQGESGTAIGNVGIGIITTPNYKLEVAGTVGVGVAGTSSTAGTGSLYIQNRGKGSATTLIQGSTSTTSYTLTAPAVSNTIVVAGTPTAANYILAANSTTAGDGKWIAQSSIAAGSADKLTVVSKTAWGQTYWTAGGVPDTISGDMTSVGNVTPSANVSKSNGSSTNAWQYVYTNYLASNTNLYLNSASTTSIIFQPGGTQSARFSPTGKLILGETDTTAANARTEQLYVKGQQVINTSTTSGLQKDSQLQDQLIMHIMFLEEEEMLQLNYGEDKTHLGRF